MLLLDALLFLKRTALKTVISFEKNSTMGHSHKFPSPYITREKKILLSVYALQPNELSALPANDNYNDIHDNILMILMIII